MLLDVRVYLLGAQALKGVRLAGAARHVFAELFYLLQGMLVGISMHEEQHFGKLGLAKARLQ
jgi:hypothetical protein